MGYKFNPFTGKFDVTGDPIAALNVKGSVADVASLPTGATLGDAYLVNADSHIYLWDGTEWDDLGALTGPPGPAGAPGADGADGVDGADGKSVLSGSGAPTTGLGSDGDFYIDTAADAIYGPKTAGAWGSPTSLIGPAGPAGPAGEAGPAGAAGSPGASAYAVAVASGFAGTEAQWLASLVGPQGEQGIQGPQGEQGSGLALQGSVPTVDDLPGGATTGDGYIVEATGDLHVWSGTAWVNAGPIQGPAGPAGAAGADGADGKTVLSGTGVPDTGLGVEGDFYIDTAASAIYGPKVGTAWGSATSLIGPQGEAGVPGPSGPQGLPGVGVPAGGTPGQALIKSSGTDYDASWQTLTVSDVFIIACSDETTALTDGVNKARFTMPYAGTLTAVKADVNTAPTGSALVVDINESGASILSTKLSIDINETSSTTAATPAVISDSALANGAVISIDIDQKGSTVAGAGLKVTLYVTRS